jgi:hypothetical protein
VGGHALPPVVTGSLLTCNQTGAQMRKFGLRLSQVWRSAVGVAPPYSALQMLLQAWHQLDEVTRAEAVVELVH